MKTSLALAMAVAVLAGCECGPGVACKSEADCTGGTHCATLGGKSGYCALPIDAGPGGGGGVGGGVGGGGGGGSEVDAGSPLAMISATPIDFGLVGCGKAPVVKGLDIVNGGTAPLTFSATLNGSSVFTMGSGTGTVELGLTTRLNLTATAPGSATAGADQTAVLTVTTNDPMRPKVDVSLKMTASGVTLGLMPTVASFGQLKVNTVAPAIPLSILNSGNVAATVMVAAPPDAQFSVTPATFNIAPGATSTGVNGGFTPTKSAPSSSAAVITVLEPVCGASVTSILLTGTGTSGSVGLSTNDVYFGVNGRVSCGTKGANRTFALTNGGTAPYAWTGTLGKGPSSPFTFSPSSGTVPAATGTPGTVTITVSTAAAIPGQATTAEEAFGDTITITTDAPNDSSHAIALHQTASGAVLNFAPSSVDFGMVPINNTASAPVSVVNDGNAPASVTLTSSNARFTIDPANPVSVGGTSFGAFTGMFAPGTSVVQQSANISMATAAGDVLCAPLPGVMTMTGIGTNGSVSYTPVNLGFGAVNCGATAAPKPVTFTNNGNASYTITPALGKGGSSAFTLSMSPDSGVVAQDGGTVIITVIPKPVPFPSAVTPNLYGDTLTVTSDVSGDTAHTIPLTETARGSIFTIPSTPISFGSVPVGVNQPATFTVTNSGNLAGTLQFSSANPVFTMPTSVMLTAAPASSTPTANFTPTVAQPYNSTATVSIAAGTVLCAPLPLTSMTLTGTGTNGNVVVLTKNTQPMNSLDFGLVDCGQSALAQSFDVKNNSSTTLTMTYTLAGGSSSPYTVSGPATIAALMSGVVTVTPKAVPTSSLTTADLLADTLTVGAMGTNVNEPHTVALHETAQGARLTFNPTALTFKASLTNSQQRSFTIDNSGNVPAPYTLTSTSSNFTVAPTSDTVGAGGSKSELVTYTSPLTGGASGSISLSTAAVLCSPAVSPLAVSGAP